MKAEFHYDFGSPNAWLSHRIIPGIEERTGATFEYVPVLLGGIFKETGNVSPMVSLQGIRNKAEYQQIETDRFLKRHGITDFQWNPFFPLNSLAIMRGAVYASGQSYYKKYIEVVFRHMWSTPKKLDDREILAGVLADEGLPASEIMTAIEDPQVKQKLISNTSRSVQMGSFGCPTFYISGAIYFGKDKLQEIEEQLGG